MMNNYRWAEFIYLKKYSEEHIIQNCARHLNFCFYPPALVKMDMVHLLGVRNKYMCYGFITTLLIWLLIGPNTNYLKHALLQYFQFSRYNFLQSDKILILKHCLPIHSRPEEILWSVFYSEILTFSTTNILIQTPCYIFINHK